MKIDLFGPLFLITFFIGLALIFSSLDDIEIVEIRSSKPITPELEITVVNGISDTTYIYKNK